MSLLSFLAPPPETSGPLLTQAHLDEFAQFEGMDNGLCWRCGHQTNDEEDCSFCGRSFEEQFEDFEDFHDPAGPKPWESDAEDDGDGPTGPTIQRPSNRARNRFLPPDEADEADVIAPKKRRTHIKQREAMIKLAMKLLQDEKDRVNRNGRSEALGNFMVSDDPVDPFSKSRLPEFRPYESTAGYVTTQGTGLSMAQAASTAKAFIPTLGVPPPMKPTIGTKEEVLELFPEGALNPFPNSGPPPNQAFF
ncbi:hypothetical protein F4810DRAFT_44495 [Camillea tinctor]|nr:hypothetical protein F4810DRAFT_44495 [Camillea tinctor]